MKLVGRYQAGRVLAVALAMSCAVGALAQSRMSDKDVQTTMDNLKNDSKKFRSNFDNAVKKSTFRKTDREKSARAMAQTFQKQTDGMLNEFKDTRKVNNSLPLVLDTANKIEDFLKANPLGEPSNASWMSVRAELDSISGAFGMPVSAN